VSALLRAEGRPLGERLSAMAADPAVADERRAMALYVGACADAPGIAAAAIAAASEDAMLEAAYDALARLGPAAVRPLLERLIDHAFSDFCLPEHRLLNPFDIGDHFPRLPARDP
jgi:hypothetical protein